MAVRPYVPEEKKAIGVRPYVPAKDPVILNAMKHALVGAYEGIIKPGMKIENLALGVLPQPYERKAKAYLQRQMKLDEKEFEDWYEAHGGRNIWSKVGELVPEFAMLGGISKGVGGIKALATPGKVFEAGKPAAEVLLNLVKRGGRGVIAGEAIGTLETGSPVKGLKTAGTFGAIEMAVPIMGVAGKGALRKIKLPFVEKTVEPVADDLYSFETKANKLFDKIHNYFKRTNPNIADDELLDKMNQIVGGEINIDKLKVSKKIKKDIYNLINMSDDLENIRYLDTPKMQPRLGKIIPFKQTEVSSVTSKPTLKVKNKIEFIENEYIKMSNLMETWINKLRSMDSSYESYFTGVSSDADRGAARLLNKHINILPNNLKEFLGKQKIQDLETGEINYAMESGIRGGHVWKIREGAKQLKQDIEFPAEVSSATPKLMQALTEIEQNVLKVRAKIKEAKPLRALQEEVKHEWRQQQAKALASIPENITGKARVIEKLRIAKQFGKMPKVNFEKLDISAAEQDSLFNAIDAKLSLYDSMPAAKGLMKIFGQYGGEVPTENELSLLGTVFGKDFVTELLAKRSTYQMMGELGYEIAGLPRAVMASFDMSAPLRQGIFLALRHPKEFAKAFVNMHRYFFVPKAFEDSMASITKRPTYELMQKARLPLTKIGGMLTENEEQYMTNWKNILQWLHLPEKLEKVGQVAGIPMAASNRAYVGFLNQLRADVFDKLILGAEKMGRNPAEDEELLRAIGKFVGATSGRGPLTIGQHNLEGSAKFLNSIMFSPRLLASRLYLLNPKVYISKSTDPFMRKEALKTLAAYIALQGTIQGVAVMAGAKITGDLSNTDALKIKVGNTRTDFTGGLQQYLVLAFREATNKTTSSTTGKTRTLGEGYKPTTRFDLLLRAAQYKEAPVASFITQWAMQQNEAGEPFKARQEITKRFVPMIMGDINDILKDDPDLAKLILEGTAGFYGAGVQTY